MVLFTQEEKENLASLIVSKDEEARYLGWSIIDAAYNLLTDEKEKRKFQNHLNHAKVAIGEKEGWVNPYWNWITLEDKRFQAFKKNILLLDIYHNPNEQNKQYLSH